LFLFAFGFSYTSLYREVAAFVLSWAELTCGFLHYRLVRTFRIATFWSIGQGRRLKMVIRGTNIDNSYVVVLLLWRETLPSIGSIVGKREVPPLHLPVLVFAFIVFAFCFFVSWVDVESGCFSRSSFFFHCYISSRLAIARMKSVGQEEGRTRKQRWEGRENGGKKLYGDVCFYCAF